MKQDKTILQAKRMEIILCQLDTTLHQAACHMVDEDVSALVVVDEQGWLRGIITRMDLIRACCQNEGWAHLPVKDFMSAEVVTVAPEDLLKDAACRLIDKQIHRVVVVNEIEGQLKPVGIVSAADL